MVDEPITLATLTTPPGRGGIAVIALAGPGAAEIVRKVFRPWKSHLEDRPGALRLGHIVDGDRILDEVVLCRVPGAPPVLIGQKGDRHRLQTAAVGASPHFAGDFYEINIHGGPLVANETMDLLQRAGAEKGDWLPSAGACPLFPPSHPQWNNPAIGREMLAALPQAHSELVVAALTQQWSGGISKLASEFLVEKGTFNFSPPHIESSKELPSGVKRRSRGMNEGKVESPLFNPQSAIRNPKSSLRRASDFLPTFRKLLNPCEVVVLGPPNAGKSTLVNALVGREVSIVHAQPGTTRDWVRELALIGGMPIYLTDTAGLWEESSDIDAQAMQRARAVANAADLVLLTGAGELRISDFGFRIAENVLRLRTKCDIYGADPEIGVPRFDVAVSAHTEQGMEELKAAILRALGLADIDPTAPMAFTERQAELLRQAAEHPDRAAGLMRQLLGDDFDSDSSSR